MVLDTSAVIELLMRTDKGIRVAELIADQQKDLHAPQLLIPEAFQVLRRYARSGVISESRSNESATIVSQLDIQFHGHSKLAHRIWAMRNNLSAYDATYLALGEYLNEPVVTTDKRLASAPTAARIILIS